MWHDFEFPGLDRDDRVEIAARIARVRAAKRVKYERGDLRAALTEAELEAALGDRIGAKGYTGRPGARRGKGARRAG